MLPRRPRGAKVNPAASFPGVRPEKSDAGRLTKTERRQKVIDPLGLLLGMAKKPPPSCKPPAGSASPQLEGLPGVVVNWLLLLRPIRLFFFFKYSKHLGPGRNVAL